MNILNEIISYKKKFVEDRKELYPIKLLEKNKYFSAPTVSLKKYLSRPNSTGIIAEFKRKSPSEGYINKYASIEDISLGYMQAGAAGLSILTDENFFGGNDEDLIKARQLNYCPILRKDFIIDEYQIFEARSIGADAILLIASVLDKKTVRRFSSLARQLGLEVLLEVKNKRELEDSFHQDIQLVGVNNRDLDTFNIDIDTSIELAELIPAGVVKISESGINNPQKITELKRYGFKGFLIGTCFMKHLHPSKACKAFINQLQQDEAKIFQLS